MEAAGVTAVAVADAVLGSTFVIAGTVALLAVAVAEDAPGRADSEGVAGFAVAAAEATPACAVMEMVALLDAPVPVAAPAEAFVELPAAAP
jgi:hypothetical protein